MQCGSKPIAGSMMTDIVSTCLIKLIPSSRPLQFQTVTSITTGFSEPLELYKGHVIGLLKNFHRSLEPIIHGKVARIHSREDILQPTFRPVNDKRGVQPCPDSPTASRLWHSLHLVVQHAFRNRAVGLLRTAPTHTCLFRILQSHGTAHAQIHSPLVVYICIWPAHKASTVSRK